ncbi:MAG: hypothetical protein AAB364_02750 [Patescibacteria group bacterium]
MAKRLRKSLGLASKVFPRRLPCVYIDRSFFQEFGELQVFGRETKLYPRRLGGAETFEVVAGRLQLRGADISSVYYTLRSNKLLRDGEEHIFFFRFVGLMLWKNIVLRAKWERGVSDGFSIRASHADKYLIEGDGAMVWSSEFGKPSAGKKKNK